MARPTKEQLVVIKHADTGHTLGVAQDIITGTDPALNEVANRYLSSVGQHFSLRPGEDVEITADHQGAVYAALLACGGRGYVVQQENSEAIFTSPAGEDENDGEFTVEHLEPVVH